MAESWFDLTGRDRRGLLLEAAQQLGRDGTLIEKDIWVVWTLRWLFSTPWREHLVFKGGTSLSKVHGVIDRFSEDIDVTYDIRELIPHLKDRESDPLPASRSQADKWTRDARQALDDWVKHQIVPLLQPGAADMRMTVRCQGDTVYLSYPSLFESAARYMLPELRIEFGGRATGEPAAWSLVTCDAQAVDAANNLLPVAEVRAMAIGRTFWEKATAAHVYCLREELPAQRFSRHWFDLACMHRVGKVAGACADRALADQVAVHKALFFREKARGGDVIDYGVCASGGLRLVPDADANERLRADYESMRDGGFLGEWQPTWVELMDGCRDIERLANLDAS